MYRDISIHIYGEAQPLEREFLFLYAFSDIVYHKSMNFLHTFEPQPVWLSLGPLTIRWYGLFVVVGILAALGVALFLARRRQINPDHIYDLAVGLVLSGILGARLYEVLFINLAYYWHHPLSVFKIWEGGLAIHGAIVGGLIFLAWFCRRKKISFWQLADLLAVVLPLGQAIGRWGNYFNQELFGWPTDSFIGIYISSANRPWEFKAEKYFHPAFLYESLLNLALFLILFFLYRAKRIRDGWTVALYLVGYSIIRFLMEFVRIDETPAWWGLRLPQWVSLLIVLAVGVGLVYFYRKKEIR